ncbi:MAG: hypothetical protein ABIT83_03795 [Massilia sp.]
MAAGEADKIVGPDKPERDLNDPPLVSTGVGSGPSFDQVGGAGLGKQAGEQDQDQDQERPATTRDRDTRAEDLQDRTGKT